MINTNHHDKAHLDKPLSDSGLWVPEVSKVDNETTKTMLSTNRILLRPLFSQESGKMVRIARGKTYNAISPLLLGFSIQMLDPQMSDATKVQPYGPSK